VNVYFEAKYAGRCAGCHEPFEMGERITITNSFTYGECCKEDLQEGIFDNVQPTFQPLRAGETICDRCRIVKPCFC
jgi:uncharacterized metal-binding protein YceD (DUF177 family)